MEGVSEKNYSDSSKNEELEIRKKKVFNYLKKVNRRLSYWLNGYIAKQIVNKSKENGVFLTYVNPRHTSTTCSRCDYRNKENRKFKQFKCLS